MARNDPRDWVQERRERTRHLIQLGGLVEKAGLPDLTNHQSNTLLGALLVLAERLADDPGGRLHDTCRQRGRAAFDADPSTRPRGRERANARATP
ncbi:conjugal transfer protein TraD [Marinivivus vitaminiproducens]|uniref:conjugal transfer protein TraD n=1 Tax=Marinivivus vitaminiproducens TaxID=3035935 RepID=UPI00279E3F1B|nr:conjugal transfer protein TraD [Geminicoccaceae bacterium SCSIO 64248]